MSSRARVVTDFSSVSGTLPRTDGVLNLSPSEAAEYLSKGAILVDLREAYETNFRVFEVPQTIHLPWTLFSKGFERLPKDRPLVLADASGIYSREAARMLRNSGFTNIAKMTGGMIDWDRDGLPVRKDPLFELSGQCACKLKTRTGKNPLLDKNAVVIDPSREEAP